MLLGNNEKKIDIKKPNKNGPLTQCQPKALVLSQKIEEIL
jgi:hypothetical protein